MVQMNQLAVLGNDVFEIQSHYSENDTSEILNTVLDFELDNSFEKIGLRHFYDIQDISELTISQDGDDAVIQVEANNTVVLKNTDSTQLTNDNFLFYNNVINSEPFDDDSWISYGEGVIFNGSTNEDDIELRNNSDDTYNTINAGAGDDFISVGKYIDNVITGGLGDDEFCIGFEDNYYGMEEGPKIHRTTITDFEINNPNESIFIEDLDDVDYSSLNISQVGSDTLITIDNIDYEIVLENIIYTDLSESNFDFDDGEVVVNGDGNIYGSESEDFMWIDSEVIANNLYAGNGDDEIEDFDSEITIYAGAGNDEIWIEEDYEYNDSESEEEPESEPEGPLTEKIHVW